MNGTAQTKSNHAFWFFSLFLAALLLAGCGNGLLFNSYFGLYAPSVDLDRDYDWYRSQMNTGSDSRSNCGPASVSMSIKYIQERNVGVEDVRNDAGGPKGWWSMYNVTAALSRYNIGYNVVPLLYREQLFSSLSAGHLVIVCLNMSALTREPKNSETRQNRFYDGVTGHFIILKGYTADRQWFLAYDSNTWAHDYYEDGSPKGKDRLYSIGEVLAAVQSWNPYYLELQGR
jgi:hypothetical protein